MITEDKIKEYNFNESLKVGVISDFQLSPMKWEKETTFEKNLVKTLKCIKNNNCQMIIVAGDICNSASKVAYNRFKKALSVVYEQDLPLIQCIMGNHDYYVSLHTKKGCRELFERQLNQSPYTHFIVNGFHFIGASPTNYSLHNGYREVLPWLKKQLDIAYNESSTKPIFVTTHIPPKDTVYGSAEWGDNNLDKLFSNYPNIVCLSGHSHYSLLDERSFYQDKYTAINTQSISYIELEKGKANGSVPPNSYMNPMGLIIDFNFNEIIVKRFNFDLQKEEKSLKKWIIEYNCNKRTDEIINDNDEPSMPDRFGRIALGKRGQGTIISFKAGVDNDFVHSYYVEYDDGVTQSYFSDFYRGIENMEKQVCLELYNKKPGIYNMKIYAVNSSGKISSNYTIINNVHISKNNRYKRVLAPEIKY